MPTHGWNRLVAVTLLAATMAAGCAAQKAWIYAPKARAVSPSPVLDKSVAVPPFADARPNVNRDFFLLYLIPLMPFGWQNFDAPEASTMHFASGLWIFKPSEDLAKAMAAELTSSRMFREAFFTYRAGEGDLVLEGKINSTKYKSYVITYGLSVDGPLLWLVGAPAGHISNVLDLEFVLRDNKTGDVLWKQSYMEAMGGLRWIYYLHADFNYDTLFADIAKKALADMETFLRRRAANPR